jgi:site-specific DNA recombinase
MQSNGHKRAAVYPRVSSKHQEDNYSIGTQLAACLEHAQQLGYTVDPDHIYRETHTGVDYWQRPQMTALRQAIRAGEIDAVVFYSVDRYARDPLFHMLGLAEARQYGVSFHIVTEDLDLSDDDDVLMFFIKGHSAKREWKDLRERSIRGRRARAQSGKRIPGVHPPYGYQWADTDLNGNPAVHERLLVDPVTTPTVQWMFDRYAAGWSIRGIVRGLAEQEIPSPRKRPHWTPATVKQLLGNPLYRGEAYSYAWKQAPPKNPNTKRGHSYRDLANAIKLPDGTAPAIVDDATWHAVQERLKVAKRQSRPMAKNREVALLRGGFAKCGYCGCSVIPNKSSGGHWYYKCGQVTAIGNTCPGWTMRVEELDAIVWEKVTRRLLEKGTIRVELERMLGDDPIAPDLEAVNRTIADVDRRQLNLTQSLAMFREFSDEAAAPVVRELEALAAHKRSAEAQRETLMRRRQDWEAARRQIDNLETWCDQIAQNLDGLDFDGRRDALRAFGISVTIYRTGHEPRYRIRSAIPLDVTSDTLA